MSTARETDGRAFYVGGGMNRIVGQLHNLKESIVDFFTEVDANVTEMIAPERLERERTKVALRSYWHNVEGVRYMIAELDRRDSIVPGFWNRHAQALEEFLKCGATPTEAVKALDDCIGTWATTPMDWDLIQLQKCRDLVMSA